MPVQASVSFKPASQSCGETCLHHGLRAIVTLFYNVIQRGVETFFLTYSDCPHIPSKKRFYARGLNPLPIAATNLELKMLYVIVVDGGRATVARNNHDVRNTVPPTF